MIRKLCIVIMAVLTLVFGGLTLRRVMQYRQSSQAYSELAANSVKELEEAATRPTADLETDEPGPETKWEEYAPIVVNFESLCGENPDCIAWLYSPDTPINYPVVQGETNDSYLHRNFEGKEDAGGCLFLDSRGKKDFSDAVSIIYGHNMRDDSMFGSLDSYSWGGQRYYAEHDVLYLLTPGGNFRLDALAGAVVSAESSLYGQDMWTDWAEELSKISTFQSDKTAEQSTKLLVLSTCSGRGVETRYVLLCAMTEIG